MLPRFGKQCWMFVAILICGIFVSNSICGCSDENGSCRQKNILFVSAKNISQDHFPTEAVYHNVSGTKFCFNIRMDKTQHAACCNGSDFNCSLKISADQKNYSLILNKEILSKQDIVLMKSPNQKYSCLPSILHNKTEDDFFLEMHKCLDKGVTNIKLSQKDLCGNNTYDKEACKDLSATDYKITIVNENVLHFVSCEPPEETSIPSLSLPPPVGNNGTGLSPENAANIMNNMSSLLDDIGNSSRATISIGQIKGMIFKLSTENQAAINYEITTSGDMNVSSMPSYKNKNNIRVTSTCFCF
ncbi:uncharacterized protein LOC121965701 [Plectropomus leopardus]|uniref:uncharacterized protein LOC121965701 n=1 Tax=Plectropomus leopardus TaxID=160734 RepID=UPI001C4D78DC|nr:uncharacterized protein LOC121965701 [Plectropomus leopardus]